MSNRCHHRRCVLTDRLSCVCLDCSLQFNQNNIAHKKGGCSSFLLREVCGKTHTLSHNDRFGDAAFKLTVHTHFLIDMCSNRKAFILEPSVCRQSLAQYSLFQMRYELTMDVFNYVDFSRFCVVIPGR